MNRETISGGLYSSLSFVRGDGNSGYNFWVQKKSGNDSVDRQRGQSCAAELVRFMRENNDPLALRGVVAAIQKKGEMGTIEIAFFTRLGQLIAAGA